MAKKKQTKKKGSAAQNNREGLKNRTVKPISEEERQHAEQIRLEVWGIIWITLGILIALAMYVISRNVIGGAVSSFIIGLLGIFGYIVPPLFIYIGIMHFTHTKHPIPKSIHIISAIFVLLVLTCINANTLNHDVTFWQYIGQAYTEANSVLFRGGVLSAIPAFALIKLLTIVGTNIVLAAATLILAIMAFRFSLADFFSRLKDKAVEYFTVPDDEAADEDDENSAYIDDGEENFNDPDTEVHTTQISPMQTYLIPPTEKKVSVSESVPAKPLPDNQSDTSIINEPEDDDYIEPEDLGLSDDAFMQQAKYQRPPLTLLAENPSSAGTNKEEAQAQAENLISVLQSFGITVTVSHISIGPTVTRFEIQPARGVRIRSITALISDIALALAAESVRIEAPIPGKQAMGIEIPNKTPSYVFLRELFESDEYQDSQSVLTTAVGKDIIGKNIVADISKMPHLLIAGSTGTGKSVCMNTIILSLVYKASPEDVKMILIDPKVVEFNIYSDLPHLLIPVVTDVKRAASALKWAVGEQSRRYNLFARYKFRTIAEYNAHLPENEEKMPRIVIIIDELAELMMNASKEVEPPIVRLAQLGRACGIHLIVATQRPTTDIITGMIKANIVSRIAFKVSDAVNAKVVLDSTGAEFLIGNGDMLFHPVGMQKPRRVQGTFVTTEEVAAVMQFFADHNMTPVFDDVVDSQITAGVSADLDADDEPVNIDSVFIEAGRLIISTGRTSASYIQQKLRVGWNRAARIMNLMEEHGVVSAPDPIKKDRVVTMSLEEFESRFCRQSGAKSDTGAE